MSSIVLLLIYVELTHVMANKMHGLVHLKLELILTKGALTFCNIGEILKNLSLIWKPDRCTETGLDPRLTPALALKGAVIFNAGYRGRRIFKTNGKLYLPHSVYSIILESPL